MNMIRVSMNAKSQHGIPFNQGLYDRNFEYQIVIDDLDGLVETRKTIMSGSGSVTHYKIGSREITKGAMSASQVLKQWDALMAKKRELEGYNGGRSHKTYGIIPRDNW